MPKTGSSWTKGMQSPNPGGLTKARRAALKAASDLVAAETDGGLTIIRFAAAVLKGEKWERTPGDSVDVPTDDKSRRWAAAFLADRLWGRAPVTVTIAHGSEPLPDLSGLSIEELQQIAADEEASGEPPAEPSGDSN